MMPRITERQRKDVTYLLQQVIRFASLAITALKRPDEKRQPSRFDEPVGRGMSIVAAIFAMLAVVLMSLAIIAAFTRPEPSDDARKEADGFCSLNAVICPWEHPDSIGVPSEPSNANQASNFDNHTPISNGVIREVTAYNSVPEQTDDTPCIAADGSDICRRAREGEVICASNAHPFGTVLEIERLGYCTVADRMNRRYRNRIDVFMSEDVARARMFGLQRLRVVVVAPRPASERTYVAAATR